MAQTSLEPGNDIEESIRSDPYNWNFFRLVRELDRFFRLKDPNMERTGFSYKLDHDSIRFGQPPLLAFPPSDVAGYTPSANEDPAWLSVYCFGLLGCNGPMPLYFTEYIFRRVRHHADKTLQRFLDIFHHRLISLYYRAWAINQIAVSKEWRQDPFSRYIGSLINTDTNRITGSDHIPEEARLFYSGRLIQKSMNAEGLCAILSGYFNTQVKIEQFTGQWIQIPEPDRCRMGEKEDTGLLGKTCVIGSKIWDVSQKFRIVLGPMPFKLYDRLVPGTKGYLHLKEWIDSYVGMTFDWEVQLILKKEEIPALKPGRGIKLGYTSWFKQEIDPVDADDLVVSGSRSNM